MPISLCFRDIFALDIASYLAMINACANRDLVNTAFAFLLELRETGYTPTRDQIKALVRIAHGTTKHT
jgi:pentatricopeptide repeat protein